MGGGVNPYQWKTLTSLDSPELVLKNANNFKFFTDDDPNNIIDPITVSYEINASADFIIRKPTTQPAQPLSRPLLKLQKHTKPAKPLIHSP